MVDRLDGGVIAADLGPLDYRGLYKVVLFQAFFFSVVLVNPSYCYFYTILQAVGKALFRAHVEGQLKVH